MEKENQKQPKVKKCSQVTEPSPNPEIGMIETILEKVTGIEASVEIIARQIKRQADKDK